MIKNFEKLEKILVDRAKELGAGCEKVFVAVSGGIDSATVVAILCKAFGPENVVGLFRNIKSNPKHYDDVLDLNKVFNFRLIALDLNSEYDSALEKIKKEFERAGLPWEQEGTKESENGFTNAYASLKSCFTTPFASFISKAIDSGRGRIFGTGNGEEDGLLRYFDKRGDGAVDNNILNGLTKAEVRQIAKHLGVPEKIITKKPSADLEANGDAHNDEDQLTKWAKNSGYNIELSYGEPNGFKEGNIAWAWKENIKNEVITGKNDAKTAEEMKSIFGYNKDRTDLILFLRQIEKNTRHKVEPIPGLDRKTLLSMDLVE